MGTLKSERSQVDGEPTTPVAPDVPEASGTPGAEAGTGADVASGAQAAPAPRAARRGRGGVPPVRERLLAVADELFYAEGVRTVGIDRVLERAGVAKASLYSTFGSKENLVSAYLKGRHARTAARIAAALEHYDTPREKLLAVYDAQSEIFAEPGFRGCAFVSAGAEARPGDAVDQAAEEYRAWVRALFADLAAQAGVAEPDTLARQLQMLYDGGGLAAGMDHDPTAARYSRAAAEALITVALGA